MKLLRIILGLLILGLLSRYGHADTKISAMPAAGALTGTEPIPTVQTGANVATTPAAITTYVNSHASLPATSITSATLNAARLPAFSGDCTTPGGSGVLTCTKINGTTPGGTCTNQAVTSISSSAVPTCTTLTSNYVDTSIAKTGTDINTSNQVTATHLSAALPATQGGTGQTTITLGDTLYGSASNVLSKLAGNTSGTKQFLSQTGTGSVSAAPAWATLASGDIPSLGANPSASIGLSAVNGSASTYLRSDGAPALSQAITPTWTGLHTFSQSPAANTVADAQDVYDTVTASSGNQQYSPALHFQGQGWKTTATAASQPVDCRVYLVPVQGSANPSGTLTFDCAVNGGAYTNVLQVTSAGAGTLTGNISAGALIVTAANTPANGINRSATNTLGIYTNSTLRGTADANGALTWNAALISAGTKFTASGCSNSATVGGAIAGQFTSGTTGTCTVTITLPTATNGWACHADDLTTPANFIGQSASTTTSCTVQGTTVTGDVIVFSAMAF